MTLEEKLVLAIGWIVCGIVSSGWMYAFAQREFWRVAADHRRVDAGLSILVSVFGPVSLAVSYLMSGFARHGWLVPGSVPPDREQ